MQPNPQQPSIAGSPTGGPSPLVPSKPRANAMAAVIAGVLALLTVAMLVWFAFQDVIYLAKGMTGGLTGMVLVNVLGGAVSAGALLVAAGFTFARRTAGAWTLCGLCAFYAVLNTVMAPVLWGTSISVQLEWLFGFDKSNGAAAGLATIFAVPTAIAAAIAASVKSHEPATATPSRP